MGAAEFYYLLSDSSAPVVVVSYEQQTLLNIITQLSSSATFQTLVGVGAAADAQAFIVDKWGGTPDRNSDQQDSAVAITGTQFPTVPPFAIVNTDPMDSEIAGVGVFGRKGTTEIALYQQRTLTGETPPQTLARWRNTHGNIRSDMEQLFGTTGCMANGAISGEPPVFLSDIGVDQQAIFSVLKLSWWA